MPMPALGCTTNRPPQMLAVMPWLAEIAANRSEPGVCEVPRSNSDGVTTLMRDCAEAATGYLGRSACNQSRHSLRGFKAPGDPLCTAQIRLFFLPRLGCPIE